MNDIANPGQSITSWSARTAAALDRIETLDCLQGFECVDDWLAVVADHLREQPGCPGEPGLSLQDRVSRLADSMVIELDACHEPTAIETIEHLSSEAGRDLHNQIGGVKDLGRVLREAIELARASGADPEKLKEMSDVADGWSVPQWP